MKRLLEMARLSLVLIGFSFFAATTYVIKEGAQEVGRWEENDGKSEIREVTVEGKPIVKTPSQTRSENAPSQKSDELFPAKYPWGQDKRGYNSALAIHQKRKIAMALYFYTTWCPYCREFEKEVLGDSQVQRFLAKFPRAQMDAEKEKDLAKQYGVTGYPTFLVLQSNGSNQRVSHSLTPKEFIKACKATGMVIP